MKSLIVLTILLLAQSSFAKIKVSDVELKNAVEGNAKLVVRFAGVFKGRPEFSVKDSMLQMVLTDGVIWPKIEKKLSLFGGDGNTTLQAYQFNNDSVRVRALLPFSLSGKENLISVVLKDNEVELSFPAETTSIKKIVAAPTVNQNSNNQNQPTEVNKLDEKYLEKLEKEAQGAPKKEETFAGGDPRKVEAAAPVPSNDVIKTRQAAVTKEDSNTFSLVGYMGKFIVFLGVVLMLFYAAVNLIKKGVFKKSKLAIFQNMKAIEVLNTTYIAPKKNLLLVKAHNQVFLIGSSEAGIQFLSEIRDVTGLLKEGERKETGDNFDLKLDEAEIVGKEMKLKEMDLEEEDVVMNSSNAPSKKLDQFLVKNSETEVKDQVKISDEIRKKIRGLRPLA